jgi:hypothetical protein
MNVPLYRFAELGDGLSSGNCPDNAPSSYGIVSGGHQTRYLPGYAWPVCLIGETSNHRAQQPSYSGTRQTQATQRCDLVGKKG